MSWVDKLQESELMRVGRTMYLGHVSAEPFMTACCSLGRSYEVIYVHHFLECAIEEGNGSSSAWDETNSPWGTRKVPNGGPPWKDDMFSGCTGLGCTCHAAYGPVQLWSGGIGNSRTPALIFLSSTSGPGWLNARRTIHLFSRRTPRPRNLPLTHFATSQLSDLTWGDRSASVSDVE